MNAPFLTVLLALALPLRAAADPALPPAAEVAAVKARLQAIQLLSFATGLEYCGYLMRGPDGGLVFSDMVRGHTDGCTPPPPRRGQIAVASVHTHGAYDPSVPAEFPTVLDMESDRREGVMGYVATPGGRLWHIDSRAMIARQICGLGCLPQDPDFHAGDDGEIAQSYSLRALKALEQPH